MTQCYSLLIPDTRLVEGATRIFVKTGPSFGDATCREDREVKVELAIPGEALDWELGRRERYRYTDTA